MLTSQTFARILRPSIRNSKKIQGFKIGDRFFDFKSKRFLAGVINLSNDSCYPSSIRSTATAAIKYAEQLRFFGADIIDIGAESTQPRRRRISVADQVQLIQP